MKEASTLAKSITERSSRRLREIARADDTVAVAPSDLFGLLLEDVSSSLGTAVAMERTLAEIPALEVDGALQGVEFRAGAAVSLAPHGRAEDLLLEAEAALVRSMKGAGTGFVLFDPPLDAALRDGLRTGAEPRPFLPQAG